MREYLPNWTVTYELGNARLTTFVWAHDEQAAFEKACGLAETYFPAPAPEDLYITIEARREEIRDA